MDRRSLQGPQEVLTSEDSIWCSARAEAFALELGFDSRAAAEVAIAVSELVSNSLKYAERGRLELLAIDRPKRGLEVVQTDDGPGIEDIERAVVDGYSRGHLVVTHEPGGLGVGLGAVRRLMDEVTIENQPGGGLRVCARKWLG